MRKYIHIFLLFQYFFSKRHTFSSCYEFQLLSQLQQSAYIDAFEHNKLTFVQLHRQLKRKRKNLSTSNTFYLYHDFTIGTSMHHSSASKLHHITYDVRKGGDTRITISPRTNSISIFLLDVWNLKLKNNYAQKQQVRIMKLWQTMVKSTNIFHLHNFLFCFFINFPSSHRLLHIAQHHIQMLIKRLHVIDQWKKKELVLLNYILTVVWTSNLGNFLHVVSPWVLGPLCISQISSHQWITWWDQAEYQWTWLCRMRKRGNERAEKLKLFDR